MAAAIKNVAIVGASGSVGAAILHALVKSGHFKVTAVKRPSSSASFPDSVTVRTADAASVDSLTAAFQGQDAVVSALNNEVLAEQTNLVEAAVAAKVKRFLPSEFGCDLANPKIKPMPIFKHKVETQDAIRKATAVNPDFTYTFVCNNAFLDWGIEKNFLINWKDSKPMLYDGGTNKFSATSLDSVGQAVVGVLSHPEETKNRFVYVKDIDISQNQLLEMAKKANPGKKWEEPMYLDTAEMEKSSYESLAKGVINMQVMVAFLCRVFGSPDCGGRFEKTDNELLGVKGKTEADVEAIFKSLMT